MKQRHFCKLPCLFIAKGCGKCPFSASSWKESDSEMFHLYRSLHCSLDANLVADWCQWFNHRTQETYLYFLLVFWHLMDVCLCHLSSWLTARGSDTCFEILKSSSICKCVVYLDCSFFCTALVSLNVFCYLAQDRSNFFLLLKLLFVCLF